VIPSIKDPFFDFKVNCLGTLNLLNSAVQNDIQQFIFASSNAPLGDQEPPMNEKKVGKPLSPYGASKASCEAYCSAFFGSYGLKTVILRFSNVYGPYCSHKSSVVAKFIKDSLQKRTMTIYGDGNQTRDFLFVKDLCGAISTILGLCQDQNKLPVWGEVFHLGSGMETSILDLARMIKALVKEEIDIVHVDQIKGEIYRNYSDISKAQNLLHYKPRFSLSKGLETTFKYFSDLSSKNLSPDNVPLE
jgi:UDP-glucose 4-epimerase